MTRRVEIGAVIIGWIVAAILAAAIFAATIFATAALAATAAEPQGVLEVPAPGSVQSGIGAISGWHCSAGRIDISIDGGPPQPAGAHTSRLDTQGVCGRTDTGFALLFNWNTLPIHCFGCRFHRVVALADGVAFADSQFEAENYGTEFLTGKSAGYDLLNFPEIGDIATLRWDETMQNFALYVAAKNQFGVAGTYYGALQTGAQNPACGPFPPNRVLPVRHATFVVTIAGNLLSLSAQYADGGACQLPAVAFDAPAGTLGDGYLHARFGATAACPELPQGLDLRVNGRRLAGDSPDNCATAHVIGAK